MKINITKIGNFSGHRNAIYRLLGIDSESFYSAGAEGMLIKWNISQPDTGLLVAKTPVPIYDMARKNNLVFLALKNGAVHVIDESNNEEIRQLLISKFPIFSLKIIANMLYIGAENGVLFALDLFTYKILYKIKLSDKSIRSLDYFDGKILAGCSDSYLYQLNPSLEFLQKTKAHSETIFSVAHTAEKIITGGKDALINIHSKDLITEKSIEAHWLHVKNLGVNPKIPDLLFSTSMDKTIRIWNCQSWELLKVIDKEKYDGHTSSVNCGLWLDEKTLISCSDDRLIMAFRIAIE